MSQGARVWRRFPMGEGTGGSDDCCDCCDCDSACALDGCCAAVNDCFAQIVFCALVFLAALACAVLVLLVPAVCLLVFTNQARAACGAGLDCCLDGGYTFDWADALGASLVIHAVTVPVVLLAEKETVNTIPKFGCLFIVAANDVFLLCCAVTLHLSTSTALVWPDGGQLQHNSSSTVSATASDNSTVRSWATREECFLGTHEPFSTALSIGRVMAWIIVGFHVCCVLAAIDDIERERRDAERKRPDAERKRREAERKRCEAERKQHEAEQKRGDADEKHQVRGGVGQSLMSLIFGGKNTAPEPESKDMCRNPMRDSNPPSTAAMAAVAATAAAPEPESKDMHRNPMRESNPPSAAAATAAVAATAAAASHNTASVNTVQQSTPRAPTRAPEPFATPPTSPYASEIQAAAAVARGAFGLLSWGASTIVAAAAGEIGRASCRERV